MSTTIICNSDKCPYRSKKPLRKWTLVDKGGKKHQCYSCTLDAITLSPMFDLDGDVYSLYGYTPVECDEYKKWREKTRVTTEETKEYE